MQYVDLYPLEEFLNILSNYRNVAYPILFIGALVETLIPFSLVIPGELFFISGAVLAGTGSLDIWMVAAVLYTGGIIGDNGSYWLGRTYGRGLFDRLSRWPLIRKYMSKNTREKGISFFQRRGAAAVFLARLSGPFSWFIPSLAGAFQLPYKRFVLFNAFGVIIGIGEFLVLGYLFGSHLDRITAWLIRLGYVPLTLSIILATVMIYLFYDRRRRQGSKR